MKYSAPLLFISLFSAALVNGEELRTFTNAGGKTMEDQLVRYDYDERIATFDRSGKVPLDTFSKKDQAYILKWNMAAGFKSKMRFKTELKKANWARMKHEQNVTPYWMDALQVPGKTTPAHSVVMIDDYEEYTALYFEAEGYAIKLKNQNFFPIENVVVESKIFYEQEHYQIPDDIFSSMEREYDDTVATNKVRFLSETIPVIVPHEEVIVHSDCAIIIDHQLDRSSISSTTEEGGEEDEDDDGGDEEVADGFGEWDDHSRRRKGKVTGIWVRIGIEGPDGAFIWRQMVDPSSLPKKVSWDPTTAEP